MRPLMQPTLPEEETGTALCPFGVTEEPQVCVLRIPGAFRVHLPQCQQLFWRLHVTLHPTSWPRMGTLLSPGHPGMAGFSTHLGVCALERRQAALWQLCTTATLDILTATFATWPGRSGSRPPPRSC